jgi:hypothetical protein
MITWNYNMGYYKQWDKKKLQHRRIKWDDNMG